MNLTVALRNFVNAPKKEMNWKNPRVAINAVPPGYDLQLVPDRILPHTLLCIITSYELTQRNLSA